MTPELKPEPTHAFTVELTPEQRYCQLRTAQQAFQKPPAELNDDQRQWLDATVEKQLALEARLLASPDAARIQIDISAVETAFDEVRAQYDDHDSFEQSLQTQSLEPDQLKQLLARQLRVDAVLERASAGVEPATEDDARDYYQRHPQQFQKPERRRVWHLLVTINDEYPENRRPAVEARLERVIDAVRSAADSDAALARFREAAKRHSECPSALSEGEIGWVSQGQLFPELDRILFTLPAGTVGPMVETNLGLHLVYCDAIDPADRLAFESVVTTLRDKLTEKKRQIAQRDWLKQLA